jgi:hypothetical protein
LLISVSDLEIQIRTLNFELDELEEQREENRRNLADAEATLAMLLKEESQQSGDNQKTKVRQVVQKESVLQQARAEEGEYLTHIEVSQSNYKLICDYYCLTETISLANIFNIFSFGIFDDPKSDEKKEGGLFGLSLFS